MSMEWPQGRFLAPEALCSPGTCGCKVLTSPDTQWEPPQARPASHTHHPDKGTWEETLFCYGKEDVASFKHHDGDEAAFSETHMGHMCPRKGEVG